MLRTTMELIEFSVSQKELVLYGAGDIGYLVGSFLKMGGVNVKYYAVTSLKENAKEILGLKVRELKDIIVTDNVSFLICTTEEKVYSIKRCVMERGFECTESLSPALVAILRQWQKQTKEVDIRLSRIEKKLSMIDNVWQFGKVKFFVPNYPLDFIQSHIVDKNEYFEQDILEDVKQYIKEDGVVLDIGANIGNHTVFFALECKSSLVCAFEPVASTYRILEKNIGLNHLSSQVKAYNLGLSNEPGVADYFTFRLDNIGDTHLIKSSDGEINLCRLDEIDLGVKQIDFIKIDTEDFELLVLQGAKATIMEFRPVIFIESLPTYYLEVNSLLREYGYRLVKSYPHYNYIYEYEGNAGCL